MIVQSQKEVQRILSKFKVPTTKTELYSKKREAVHTKLKYPLVLKIDSKDIVHKTDFGAVITNIKNKSELAQTLADVEKRINKLNKDIKFNYLLQTQEQGKEIIIGMKRDAQFGPVILFGMGGVMVEIFKDVSMRIAPLTKTDINSMINEIKASKILKGFRGEKSVNINAIKDILSKISKLSMHEKKIEEIDFNPVIVNEKYATVVDARILLSE